MPSFQYNALDRSRGSTTGTLEAPTRREAILQLAARQLFVTQLDELGTQTPATTKPDATDAQPMRVSARARAEMLRQLATAVGAGLPLLVALRSIEQQVENKHAIKLLHDLGDRVQAGESLSDAMHAYPRVFSPLHVSMARAGETAGVLDEVLLSMADFAERDLDIREKIRSAATYPLIVVALALASVVVILTFILPRILSAVTEATAALPWPTRVLLGTSDLLRSWGWLMLIAGIAGVWAFRQWLNKPEGRLAFDSMKLRIPVLGQTLRKAAVARFARTLGTLTRSGIQILEALRVLRDTLGNEALGRKVDEVTAAITQGQSIAEPLRQTGEFPPMFIQVIALGERTGKLDEMLLRAADAYDRETSAAIQRTMTVLPALFIVVLAVIVAFILAAVLLPIVNMQTGLPGQ